MIFMSQSGITDPTLQTEWAIWYVEHLRIMQTVEGIDSAVRFLTSSPGWPPSLAMYTIRSPEVFQDPYYLSIRGMGPWATLIDKRFYLRNLFEAVNPVTPHLIAPSVPVGSTLVVTDQARPTLDIEGLDFLWLKSVGLDLSTSYRGIAVTDQQLGASVSARPDMALYI
jgi:hypothetical protein